MAAVGDVNTGLVLTPLNAPCLVDRVELGMERTAEDVKG